MDIDDFREMALSFKGAEEGSHMGAADFRVGGRIFATLAMQDQGFGNLMLTPDLQKSFISGAPEIFLAAHGGWGRMGITHIRLAVASEYQLAEALKVAWQLRVEKNQKIKTSRSRPKSASKKPKPKKSS